MSIFDRIAKAVSGDDKPSETSSGSTPTVIASEPTNNIEIGNIDEIFGERVNATEIAPPLPREEISKNAALKQLSKQVGGFLGIGEDKPSKSKQRYVEDDEGEEDDEDDEYENDDEGDGMIGLFSENYLRNVAQLRLTQLKLKHNLKVQGMKLLLSKALEGVGKQEQANDVWDTDVVLEDIDELLEEIIFMQLTHQAKMGKLIPLSPEEFLSGMTLVQLEKLGGKGFENFIELGKGAFNKGQELIKNKKPVQSAEPLIQ